MAQFYSPKPRTVHSKKSVTSGSQTAIRVVIDELDPLGQGVARDKGKLIFVEGALPSEQVEITLSEEKRQYAKARVIQWLTESPARVAPRCPYIARCGGCQLQHADLLFQQESKRQMLHTLLKRVTGEDTTPQTVIGGEEYGYRRRARFGVQYQRKTDRLSVGFRQSRTNQLVEIEQCSVLKPELNQIITPLKQVLSQLAGAKNLGHVELVLADNVRVVVIRTLSTVNVADRQKLLAFAEQYTVTVYLAADEHELELLVGEAPWYVVDGMRLYFNPRGFIQVNQEINQKMIAQAVEWLDIQPSDYVMDLFSGMGNFTLPLAKKAHHVVAIEGVASLVEQGQANAEHNGLNNVHFYHANLEQGLTHHKWLNLPVNKVLLDPARAGAAAIMEDIVHLSPERIVYVSCNPATLARDSAMLLAADYRLVHIRMLDMFPHTTHVESMVLFVNNRV